jgi:hypothetical protein
VTQLVSVIVVLAAAAQGRTLADLAVPGDQVRDDRGRIVACRGITRGVKAWPRARWQRLPRVAVFGSAARWLLAERKRAVAKFEGHPAPAKARAPRDVDVAFCGMDPAAVNEVVGEWFNWGEGQFLRETFGRLPIDMHCLPGAGDTLVIPRPARLTGEGSTVVLDEAVIPVFGGADGVTIEDVHSLPAILRRASALLHADVPVADVVEMVVSSWPSRVDILVGDGGDRQDCYLGSSTAALRRALEHIGPPGALLRDELADRGLPVATVWTAALCNLNREALAAMQRGAPSGLGPTLRIGRDRDVWCIGPVHCSPHHTADRLAAEWLASGRGTGPA